MIEISLLFGMINKLQKIILISQLNVLPMETVKPCNRRYK